MTSTENRILDKRQIQQKISRIAYEIYENNYLEKTIYIAGIIFFYIKTNGLFGLTLTLLIAIITLPVFIKEILIIRRCQAGSDR